MIKVAGQLDTGHYLSLSITHHLVLPPLPLPHLTISQHLQEIFCWLNDIWYPSFQCMQSVLVCEVKSSDWSVKMSVLSRSKCSKLLAIFAPSGTFYKLNTQHWRFVTFHSCKKDLGEADRRNGNLPSK